MLSCGIHGHRFGELVAVSRRVERGTRRRPRSPSVTIAVSALINLLKRGGMNATSTRADQREQPQDRSAS